MYKDLLITKDTKLIPFLFSRKKQNPKNSIFAKTPANTIPSTLKNGISNTANDKNDTANIVSAEAVKLNLPIV